MIPPRRCAFTLRRRPRAARANLLRGLAIAAAASVLLSACGPSTYVRRDHEFASLPPACCPLLLGMNDAVPPGVLLVGEVRYGETGFSTDCSYAENMERIRQQACGLGADVVHITAQNFPNFVSTCYRVRASLYRSNAGPDSDPSAREAPDASLGACETVLTRRFRAPKH
ncbi:MAG: hypothetical protein ABR538_05640 [Candidatus Binatia bacterium]